MTGRRLAPRLSLMEGLQDFHSLPEGRGGKGRPSCWLGVYPRRRPYFQGTHSHWAKSAFDGACAVATALPKSASSGIEKPKSTSDGKNSRQNRPPMAFLLLPLEADFGFSQVERVLAFRPDRLAASKSATGGQKWHLTATGGRFWHPRIATGGRFCLMRQNPGRCHVLPPPLPRVAAATAAATAAAATAAAAAAHKEGSPW